MSLYDSAYWARQDIETERIAQDAKWGIQNHDPITWCAILTEEVGEFARAALDAHFGGEAALGLISEAVQVAAVAQAIVECAFRNHWREFVEEGARL